MRIKWISVRELHTATVTTVARFPLLALILLAGAGNHLYMNIFENHSLKYYSRNLFMSIVLLVPLLYSVKIFHECKWVGKLQKYLLRVLSVGLAGVYFYFLPNSQLLAYHFSQFWLFLSMSFLLSLVCIKDCLTDDDLLWHFHIALLARLNITLIYTSVILAGSSAAFGAIDVLFNTDLLVSHEIRVVILTLWLFAPLFFLSGVPSLEHTEELRNYRPKWIKNIAIYILIPLTTIYLGILYAYLAKIAAQWQLPEGMVSYLVLSFAAFGITTLLLVFPFQREGTTKWTMWFGRLFYYLQFPLLILLSTAIYRRVADYGITFRRYYVVALAVWLLFITVFMTYRKNRNLVAIPLSLLVLALLSSFGPWNAFNASFLSQKGRLDKLLAKHNLVVEGKLKKPTGDLPAAVKSEISSISKYLFDYGKLDVYADMVSFADTLTPKAFARELGFEYKGHRGATYEDVEWFQYSFEDTAYSIANGEFDVLAKLSMEPYLDESDKRIVAGDYVIQYLPGKTEFRISTSSGDSAAIFAKDVVEAFGKSGKGRKIGKYIHETGRLHVVCLFGELAGRRKPAGIEIRTMDVDLLIKRRE